MINANGSPSLSVPPNQPRAAPQLTVSWPIYDVPDNPHHCIAVDGCHGFGSRAIWDADAIARDFATDLKFSECRPLPGSKPFTGQWKMFTFAPAQGVVVAVRHPIAGMFLLTVWASSPEIAKTHFNALRDKYWQKPKQQRCSSTFTVIISRHGMLDTRTINVIPAVRREADLRLNYGHDFVNWNASFLSTLKRQQSGLTILRGEPGTGKTTYLRYLTYKLRRTHCFYYLPLNVYPMLADPSAVDFWLGQNDASPELRKVVVLEDAEALLMQRAPDNQVSVSNLLNICDGFLGDVLKLQVICTVNCSMDRIDPALMRPGRLLTHREFTRLSAEDAKAVAATSGVELADQDDYSLAELYRPLAISAPLAPLRRAGFA